MRARAIREGGGYWLRVKVSPVRPVPGVRHGGRGFAGWTVRQRVTVIDVASQAGHAAVVTVEATRWRCINAHWFTHDLARAMVDGKLRYQPKPHRWTVSVRHILAPVADSQPAGADGERSARRGAASRARHEGQAS